MTVNPTHDERMKKEMQEVGIPVRSFMYTFEQVAEMLQVSMLKFESQYVRYENRQPGIPRRDKFQARNIAPDDQPPQWRIVDNELLRWFRYKKFHVQERGWIRS